MNRRVILVAATWTALIGANVAGADAQSVGPLGTQFTLSGVTVIDGGGRAWLQEPTLTQNRVVAVRPGDSIGPYRVTGILEDRVELEGPNGKLSVRLAGALGTAPVATASAAPAPEPTPTPADTPSRHLVISLDPVAAQSGPRLDFESLLRGITPPR